MNKKTVSRIREMVKSLDAAGVLTDDQKEEVDKAVRKIRQGLNRRDMRAVEDGISRLAQAFLKVD